MSARRRMNGDRRHELKEAIWEKVHELVNQLTADLHPDDDEEIRQQLTEQFRFWRLTMEIKDERK